MFVPRDYIMDPVHEDLLFEGADLREGMIVLIESSLIKENPERVDEWSRKRVMENNRWCTVLRVNVRERFDHDDYGHATRTSPLVEMLCEYPDGVKAKRSFDNSYAWIVKRDSIPS